MNVGALCYWVGEKSDAYLWARGSDFMGPPDPQPSRVSSFDWPSNDPTFYARLPSLIMIFLVDMVKISTTI
jgi:hypothetical protein